MHTYLFLRDPAHSRVYFAQSAAMAAAELESCKAKMGLGLENIREVQLAGMPAIEGTSAEPLSAVIIASAILSFVVYLLASSFITTATCLL